jgi:RNA polymerase sigma factor (sigma-70 family)
LLRNYVETGSNQAFEQLVARHFDLVYCSALRMLAGDAHLAQDVAQQVFTDLARKAVRLPPNLFLSGWLYKHTCFTAANAVRTERRRENRERQAAEMTNDSSDSDAVWRRLAPVLDEAMRELKNADRDAIVLRFFDQQPFHAVGDALGTSEDGARKRVDRALEKMRSFFAARGLSMSSMVLANAMETHAAGTAPAGLSNAVATAALAGAAKSGGLGLFLIKLMTMTKAQIAVGGLLTVLAATLIVQSQTSARLRNEIHALHDEVAQLDALRAENERLRNDPAPVAPESENQVRELARLRAEAGRLRDQLAAARKTAAQNAAAHEKEPATDAQEQFKQNAVARMSYARHWGLAFIEYAAANTNMYPTNFDQAAPYLPDEAKGQTNLTPDQMEIVYQGSTTAISNYGNTIVLREKDPQQAPDGGWLRVYVFGDGHAQLHSAANGDFSSYENQYLPVPNGQ